MTDSTSFASDETDRSDAEVRIQEALGQSESFLTFQEQLSRVARVDRPVLIMGERGTGKELAASRLHFLSKRWQEPFVALNCSALAPSLIESELFGHEEGAFTGAARRRTGRFEAAHDGTLFLDEIGTIPVVAQEKILRVVEYGAFERVGSSESTRVNVRIVGATNADLRAMAATGEFKEDLLDRLSFEVLFLPPLRERREDIMLLATHFASRMAFDLGWSKVAEYTEKAVSVLEEYPWPGNVRELKNVVERAVYRSDDNIITAEEVIFDPFEAPYQPLPGAKTAAPPEAPTAETRPAPPSADPLAFLEDRPFNDAVREVEVHLLRDALVRTRFNQRKAADHLGLTYHQFRGLYRKYQEFLEEE
ncbi:MAG: phage shock protein operon transcriptional activator [bacterium]|nr:phage shock protein operon transcriptional activator [bacterium]